MSFKNNIKNKIKNRLKIFVILTSIIGYALVLGAISSPTAILPKLGAEGVNFLSDAIAVINTFAILSLISGWYYIRKGNIDLHRKSMITAFSFILLFLILYILKTGSGGTKVFLPPQGQEWIKLYIYLPVLGIHLILSIISVPIVIYTIFLGLTHSPEELTETPKKKVGKIAASAWILSLFLGILTYILLNIYPTKISYGTEIFIYSIEIGL